MEPGRRGGVDEEVMFSASSSSISVCLCRLSTCCMLTILLFCECFKFRFLDVQVRCSLSGHEMPCCLEVLQSYVGGRKFARLRSLASLDCTSLEPFIISSTQKK